jgi:hypothetical protein
MTKKELKLLLREEVKKELYAILPELLRTVITDVMKQMLMEEKSQINKSESKQKIAKKDVLFDVNKLKASLGYGDMNPTPRAVATPPAQVIAGVPVEGGLRDWEAKMGVAHLNDVAQASDVASQDTIETYEPSVAGSVPDMIVDALGQKAKKVLEEAERRKNWRPGVKS